MGAPPETRERRVTPLETTLAAGAVLGLGAVLTGSAHYASTAKRLAEEGVEAAARVRAMPLALRALGASTALCAVTAGAAVAAWQVAGLESRGVAQVASFTDAVALAKQQRVSASSAGEGQLAGEDLVDDDAAPGEMAGLVDTSALPRLCHLQDLVRKELRAAVLNDKSEGQ